MRPALDQSRKPLHQILPVHRHVGKAAEIWDRQFAAIYLGPGVLLEPDVYRDHTSRLDGRPPDHLTLIRARNSCPIDSSPQCLALRPLARWGPLSRRHVAQFEETPRILECHLWIRLTVVSASSLGWPRRGTAESCLRRVQNRATRWELRQLVPIPKGI